jgi:hypothetical protein
MPGEGRSPNTPAEGEYSPGHVLSVALGSYSESQEFREVGWINANFSGGRPAYCQIEIHVTEEGTPPWHIGSSRGSLSSRDHACQWKTRGNK